MERLQRRVVRGAVLLGSILGTGSLAVVAGFVAAERSIPPGQPALRLAILAIVALVALAGCAGLWLTFGVLLRRMNPSLSSRDVLTRAALAWWPAVAFVPLPPSLAMNGAAAHHLLRTPHEGRTFALYVALWIVLLHVGLVVAAVVAAGALASRRMRRLDAKSAVGGVWDTAPPGRVPLLNPFKLSGIATVVALAVTGTALVNWGFVQQLTMRQGEFQSHFQAAQAMMRGELPYRLQLDIWAQINVPPATLLFVYAPWMVLPDVPRLIVYGTLHVAAFATAVALLLRRILSPAIPIATIAVLVVLVGSIYAPWRESFWLGQPNGFIFLSLTLALFSALRRRWVVSGALVALSLVFKPFASWVLLYFLLARRVRALAGAAVAGSALLAVSVLVSGFEVWQAWLVDKAPLLMRGTTHHTSISLPVLHNRLFLTSHAYYLSVPPPDLPLAAILNGVASLSALLLLLALVRPGRAPDDRIGQVLEFSLAVTVALMLSPLTWLHYATATLIAFVALMAAVGRLPAARSVKRTLAGLGVAAFVLLSIDQELLLIRTSKLWEQWPLIGSISNLGLPLLVAAVAITLWLKDRPAVHHTPAEDGRLDVGFGAPGGRGEAAGGANAPTRAAPAAALTPAATR